MGGNVYKHESDCISSFLSINSRGCIMKHLVALWRLLVGKLLTVFLPERMKRMMLVSSLAAYISRQKELDLVVLTRLNEDFKLCTLEEALYFPVAINSLLWHGRMISEISKEMFSRNDVSEGKLTVIAQRIKASVPCWLRYDELQLSADIKHLLKDRHSVLG
jgi:hypothetical protein